MVESVVENLRIKREVFQQLGEICKERVIPTERVMLCSNTLTLSVSSITEGVCEEYRGSCIGMRFLHPVWFVDEVELKPSEYTLEGTYAAAVKLLTKLNFQHFHFNGADGRRLEATAHSSSERQPARLLPKGGWECARCTFVNSTTTLLDELKELPAQVSAAQVEVVCEMCELVTSVLPASLGRGTQLWL